MPKISELTSAGTLTGTEVLPIVQSSSTVKVTIDAVVAFVSAEAGGEPTISKSTGYLTWNGSAWVWKNETYALSSDLAAKANLASPTFTGTVAGITKSMVGLGNCDDTSDASKPISTAQQTALDLKANALLTINDQTGTSYTLVLADALKYIRMNNASASTLTVPPNADVAIAVGSTCHVRQVGAGQVTLVAGTGVTINTPETLKLRKAGAIISLTKVATNEWDVYGDLEAA